MSSVHIPRVLSSRGKTSLDVERENFERAQTTAIQKAINQQETPVKEKHARVILIGSHKEKGAGMFWMVARTQLPLQGNPITCWKFCHMLHKLLREGHPQSIPDSLRYQSLIVDLGKLWGHLREGYGQLIAHYCKLLGQKLQFHQKNPDFPGSLLLESGQLDKICNNDINSYFELSVDMLDYMDDILILQKQVYGSLDMSRSNSMTSSGQCRLSPLIQCIQDSCQLYDRLVKILFRLHSSLPADTLSGHRERFYKQYKILKQFYHSSSNLQYFKNLIRVPHLPDDPPNFLRASDLSSHVTPVVVVPDQPPEQDADTDSQDATVDILIDTNIPVQPVAALSAFNGAAPSPPAPDDRDLLISRLMSEISELRQQLSRVKAEGAAMVESLQNRLKELEMELEELRQIAEASARENEVLRTSMRDGEKNMEAAARLAAMEKISKSNEEKFKKMKEIYASLREEHVKLLRTHADVNKQLGVERQEKEEIVMDKQEDSELVRASMQQSSTHFDAQSAAAAALKVKMEQEKLDLEDQLKALSDSQEHLRASLAEAELKSGSLNEDLTQANTAKEKLEALLKKEIADANLRMLSECAVEEAESIVEDAMAQAENPQHTTCCVYTEYLINRGEPVIDCISKLKESISAFSTDKNEIGQVVKSVCDFSHHLGDTIMLGFATGHVADIDACQDLTNRCKASGEASMKLFSSLKSGYDSSEKSDEVSALVNRILELAKELMPKTEDIRTEDVGDMVDKEMAQTSKSIEAAAARIAELLDKSRGEHTGLQLEVNERILDSCNSLMLAIRVLVEKSKHLQREIVGQGRGISSAKEFYKKHHRWTEGLISGAKAVGWGANVLLESADKVVRGEGKFEELMVCSQEIAASTTQLVVVSKVKAARDSKCLHELAEASRGVTSATGRVVASAKSAAQMVEDLDTLDFSKLTLHQAKRLEMESQVHLLELESNVEKERVKLAELRRTHYKLAAESEAVEEKH
ncbi:hypothetical protein CAPTEDRAFT_179070 [Capitella teleta]|uniref:I/LWEQ domain-containing protein n=1 Tax=Capitella teleta TaxID=283909 RepID=R7TKR8_CAPTE|nr:hypothetical protein CAPTEDRAFT_179070 [Capitella teleta]|eukprot:ELT94289.1 hypothetical protein CAPTEDRAFT_179070 [Capitella teleta]